jgi:hypothetical protein
MFSEDLYDLVITKLNLNSESVVFKGGYLIGIYETIPYVVDQSTSSKFDYARTKVIPVSEELSQETPSVNLADRSDYIFQYQVMFQSSRKEEVLTALDEFRDYFFDNKQHTIDGYTVAFKTSRANKVGTQPHGGDFWTFYKISVYLTAIKDGYIKKDTDIWQIRLKEITAGSFIIGASYQIVTVGTTSFTAIGASANTVGVIFTATGIGAGTGTTIMTTVAVTAPTTYETLKLESDRTGTQGIPTTSSKGAKVVGLISHTSLASKIRFFYDSTAIEKQVYNWIMNKLSRNTLFDIKHTFDSTTHSYDALISGGARTLLDNGTVILEFDWIEADI